MPLVPEEELGRGGHRLVLVARRLGRRQPLAQRDGLRLERARRPLRRLERVVARRVHHAVLGESRLRVLGLLLRHLRATPIEVGVAHAPLVERAPSAERLDLVLRRRHHLEQPGDAEGAEPVERVLELRHGLPRLRRALDHLVVLGALGSELLLVVKLEGALQLLAVVLGEAHLELPGLLDLVDLLLPALLDLGERLAQRQRLGLAPLRVEPRCVGSRPGALLLGRGALLLGGQLRRLRLAPRRQVDVSLQPIDLLPQPDVVRLQQRREARLPHHRRRRRPLLAARGGGDAAQRISVEQPHHALRAQARVRAHGEGQQRPRGQGGRRRRGGRRRIVAAARGGEVRLRRRLLERRQLHARRRRRRAAAARERLPQPLLCSSDCLAMLLRRALAAGDARLELVVRPDGQDEDAADLRVVLERVEPPRDDHVPRTLR